MEGFFSTLTRQLLDGMRCSDRDEARDRIGRWFELLDSRVERPRHWTWGIDGESHDLDEVVVRDAVFHVADGNACRPQDAGLRAARPRTAAGSRPRRARRAEASGPGWEQLELPLVWDDPVTLELGKEAA